jgi:hypothetical protein
LPGKYQLPVGSRSRYPFFEMKLSIPKLNLKRIYVPRRVGSMRYHKKYEIVVYLNEKKIECRSDEWISRPKMCRLLEKNAADGFDKDMIYTYI